MMAGGNLPDSASVRTQVEGLLAWWALAGVGDAIGEESVNWLRPRPVPASAATESDGTARPTGALPDSFDALRNHLATAPDLPESRWPGPRILPSGPQAPRLMIILPAPDAAAREGEGPLRGDALALLGNMMRAIGLTLDECHIASLSLVAPPGGLIPPEIAARLAVRMRHHIGLVAPKTLVLAGDQTSRALIPADAERNAENLPFVNHEGGKVAAAAILHPRLLLGQPSAKADAWRALRCLVRGWGQ